MPIVKIYKRLVSFYIAFFSRHKSTPSQQRENELLIGNDSTMSIKIKTQQRPNSEFRLIKLKEITIPFYFSSYVPKS